MALFKTVPPGINKKANKTPLPSLTTVTSLVITPGTLTVNADGVGHATVTARNYRGSIIALPGGITVVDPAGLTVVTIDGATLTITAGSQAGTESVRVRTPEGLLSDPMRIDVIAAPETLVPAALQVTVSNTQPMESATIDVTARVLDQHGNPLSASGIVVTWSKTGAGGAFASPTTVTDAQGRATVAFTVAADDAITHVVTATAPGITGQSPAIDVQPSNVNQTVADQILAFIGPTIPFVDYGAHGWQWYVDRAIAAAESQWTQFGATTIVANAIAGYERAVFFYLLWIYTGDAKWLTRANAIVLDYRAYIANGTSGVAPHWSQMEMLYCHWLITGDLTTKNTIKEIANHFIAFALDHYLTAGPVEERMQARVITGFWVATLVWGENYQPSESNPTTYGQYLDTVITDVLASQTDNGHADFTCGGTVNYMVGMVFDILTRLYRLRPGAYNATILDHAKRVGAYLWGSQWRGTTPGDSPSFNYVSVYCEGTGSQTPAPDLNGLLVPLFGFLGKYDTDNSATWFTRGDLVFGGIQQAFWEGYRQFSEGVDGSWRYPGYKYAP